MKEKRKPTRKPKMKAPPKWRALSYWTPHHLKAALNSTRLSIAMILANPSLTEPDEIADAWVKLPQSLKDHFEKMARRILKAQGA